MTLTCYSTEAQVKVINKKEFLNLEHMDDPSWKYISQQSQLQYFSFMAKYAEKLQKTLFLKNPQRDDGNEDMKAMCYSLMKEQFWDSKPTAIEMFSIKKHMMMDPTLKNTSIKDMTKNDYDNLKGSDWA